MDEFPDETSQRRGPQDKHRKMVGLILSIVLQPNG
jgi:hypothetical protein